MNQAQMPAISLEGVRKSRGNFELGPVDLSIKPGYVVAVVGLNGGGKSTLFGMLMNLLQPDSGEIKLFGSSYPQDEVEIKRRIGYVPERPTGHDEMNAYALGKFVSRWYPQWDQRLYRDLLGRLGVDPGKRFGELSKGVRRRVSFAVALAASPELLLLDEPTAGVDPLARREMLDDISHFVHDDAREGDMRTAVFSTHAVEEARRIADYIVLLSHGEFLGLHEKEALLESWKTLWVEGEPEGDVAGVVEIKCGSPARIVSDSPRETSEALRAQNKKIVRSRLLDLEEIVSHLLHRSREGQGA
ncbi:MAG: ABC transporter ATP-binding protein [Rubrobacter sp.]|nr:ABC transporter ATP-binding protein [Rubrobacter sp.]